MVLTSMLITLAFWNSFSQRLCRPHFSTKHRCYSETTFSVVSKGSLIYTWWWVREQQGSFSSLTLRCIGKLDNSQTNNKLKIANFTNFTHFFCIDFLIVSRNVDVDILTFE